MKYIWLIVFVFILSASLSACYKKNKLPEGFKLISIDGNSYFILMSKRYVGDRTAQREVGKLICVDMYNTPDYCDVYFWTDINEIPRKFPIINRKSMIGLFQMRLGKIRLRALTNTIEDIVKINSEEE